MSNHKNKQVNNRKISRWLKIFGPGIITGAADDDPSGIATYSQTGAQFGLGMLWAALYQLPLVIAIQEACARIGAVTGKGLAGVIKANYSKKLLVAVVSLVVLANIINIGADIGAVASSAQLIWDLPFIFYAIAFAILVIVLEVFVSYKKYVKFLKWLTLALLVYILTALIVGGDWWQFLKRTLVPHIEFSFAYLFIITGVFGATITPYMFFWQASEEVEEEIAHHNLPQKGGQPRGLPKFLRNMRIDTVVGMTFSELGQWFIIVTTASVLFNNGINDIASAADAARALEPLVQAFPNSGQIAKDLFAVGIIGLGLLGIPVLAGSAAYALSEAFGWPEGLYRKLRQAKGFYSVIIISTLVGLLINFIGINPFKALIFTAVFNGIAAVPLLFVIAKINANSKILGEYKGGKLSSGLIWLTFMVMALAALSLFYTLLI
ncbi:MAG: divalent metal cation transporter [Patescibacteria group bacterium]